MVGPHFWRDIFRIKASAFAIRCRVVVFLRVREPLSWYKSYYNWAVYTRQQRGDIESWGANFTDWLPPNMQCRFLLHGTFGQGSEWAGAVATTRPAAPRHLSPKRWSEVEHSR